MPAPALTIGVAETLFPSISKTQVAAWRAASRSQGAIPINGRLRSMGSSAGSFTTTGNSGSNATYIQEFTARQSGFGLRVDVKWLQIGGGTGEQPVGNGATHLKCKMFVGSTSNTFNLTWLNGTMDTPVLDDSSLTAIAPGVRVVAGQKCGVMLYTDVGTLGSVGNKIPQGLTSSAALSDSFVRGLNGATQAASGTTSVTLQIGASGITDYYKNGTILFLSGPCAGDPAGSITAYNGTTKVATVTGLAHTPTAGGGDNYAVFMDLTAIAAWTPGADGTNQIHFSPLTVSVIVPSQDEPVLGWATDSRGYCEGALDSAPNSTLQGFPAGGFGSVPMLGPFVRANNGGTGSVEINYPLVDIGRPGTTMSQWAQLLNYKEELGSLSNCDIIEIDLGINDMNATGGYAGLIASLQSTLANIHAAAPYAQIWITTQTPHTYSTDNWTTAVNQVPSGGIITGAANGTAGRILVTYSGVSVPVNNTTVVITGSGVADGSWTVANSSGGTTSGTFELLGSAYTVSFTGSVQNMTAEATRTSYNTTLLTGIGATVPMSNPYWKRLLSPNSSYPGLTGIIDMAATVEVNSSNVLTPNGGAWIVGGTYITGMVTSVATSSSLTTTGAAGFAAPSLWTTNMFEGIPLKITSGTGAGQTAIVTSQSQGVFQIAPNWAVTPDNTSVVEAIQTGTYGVDRLGIHQSSFGAQLEAVALVLPAEIWTPSS